MDDGWANLYYTAHKQSIFKIKHKMKNILLRKIKQNMIPFHLNSCGR